MDLQWDNGRTLSTDGFSAISVRMFLSGTSDSTGKFVWSISGDGTRETVFPVHEGWNIYRVV